MPNHHYQACLSACLESVVAGEALVLLGGSSNWLFAGFPAALWQLLEHQIIYIMDDTVEVTVPDGLSVDIRIISAAKLADLIVEYPLHETWH